MIELKAVPGARRWYLSGYWSQASSANSLMVWLHEIQEQGTETHRTRYGSSPISNDDIPRSEIAFQKNPGKFLMAASAEPGTPFSSI